MKKISNSLSGLTVITVSLLTALAVLNSCGVYKKYQSQTEVPKDLYGQLPDGPVANDSIVNIVDITWIRQGKHVYPDQLHDLLQQEIDAFCAGRDETP